LSNLSTSTADQLAAARLTHWHQNAEPILTINMLRDWLNASGLILYIPRMQQIPSPAPSFVESILGTPNAAPTLAEAEQPRSLLARLIADGGAIPLNLLGNPTGTGTETPDFIVSPLAFPYIFTLRGDKAWKQPPATSGAAKVSPLALATYNLLVERITLSAYDLATQLGKEVTEAAVLRALTELWQHLRVIPIPQSDGAATLWELTSTRFTKQIKAGANAGQPTALSALITLYLGQAIVATEDDIETFLSPIASRSRIRDVVHALMSARHIETIAIDGRTVLHVNGELPDFLAIAAPAPEDENAVTFAAQAEGETESESESTDRIKKFVPKPRKVGTGYVTKPGTKPFASESSNRERRPFTRESNRPDRPSFTKPWAEEKADRLAASRTPSNVSGEGEAGDSAPRPYTRKPSFDREGKRPFGSKPSFGNKPAFGSRPSFGNKPRFDSDRPAFRRDNESGDARPRSTFSRPGTFDRKREGFAGKSFDRSDSRPPRRDFGDSRPPRRDFGDSRPPRRDFGDSRPPRREFTPRPEGDRDSRPPRRTFGDKPSFAGPRQPGSYAPRAPREGGAGPSRFGGKPSFSRDRDDRGSSDRGGRGERPSGPPFRKFDAPRGDRPSRPFSDRPSFDRPARSFSDRPAFDRSARPSRPFSSDRPDRSDRPSRPARPEGSGGYAGKPSGGFGAKKPYGKSSGGYAGKSGGSSFGGKKPYGKSAAGKDGKPVNTFDKFKGNKKPFGNRPPARKFKPDKGASAE
jgi:23S rRNA pseudouridine2605 synthase